MPRKFDKQPLLARAVHAAQIEIVAGHQSEESRRQQVTKGGVIAVKRVAARPCLNIAQESADGLLR